MKLPCLPTAPILIAILLSQTKLPIVPFVVAVFGFFVGRTVDRFSPLFRCDRLQNKVTAALAVTTEAALIASDYGDLGNDVGNGLLSGLILSQTNWDFTRFRDLATGVLFGFFLTMAKTAEYGQFSMHVAFALVFAFYEPPSVDGNEHKRIMNMPFYVAAFVGFGPAVRTGDWRAACVVALFTIVAVALSCGMQRTLEYRDVPCASKWFIMSLQLCWFGLGLLDFDDRELYQLVPSFVLFPLVHFHRKWLETQRTVVPRDEASYVAVLLGCGGVYLISLLTHAALVPMMFLDL